MATYTSAATGLWSAGATWVGGVKPPSGAGHKITIAATHVVTFDEAAGTYGDDTLTGVQVNGTLKASRSVSTALTCRGDLFIDTNGTLDYGTEADPIPSTTIAQLIINDSATMAHSKWGIRTIDTANWLGFRIWGALKTRLTNIVGTALSTDTSFTIADVTGWEIGDWLVFEGSVIEASTTGQRYRAITDIVGNVVTIGASLGYDSQASRKVLNLTSNVRVMGSQGNLYRTHISVRVTSSFATVNAIEIGPCELRTFGYHASNTWQFGGLVLQWGSGSNLVNIVKNIDGLVIHDIWSISGSTITSVSTGSAGIVCFTNQAYNYKIKNACISSNLQSSAMNVQNGASVTFENLTVIRAGRVGAYGYSQGPVGLVYDGGYASGLVSEIISSTGVSVLFKNMTFDGIARYSTSASAFGSVRFENCTFGPVLGVYAPSATALAFPNGALVPALMDNCTFPALPIPVHRTNVTIQNTKPETYWAIRNGNNDTTKQYKYTRTGEQSRENSVTNRGTSSIRCDAWFAATPNAVSRTFPALAGQAVTVVGYLRFAATFGTATPPSVTISGLGIAPAVFTAPATADTWHKFSLTVTNPQAYAGEFTVTASGVSAANAIGAYFYLDGVPFADYVTSVRHYGYLFDANVNRTVDTSIAEFDETVVAAYAAIDTLDKLHDRLNLWACENQSTAVFYDHAGADISLGNYNLVVDATAAQAFNITGSTITIKASTLAAGSSFSKIATTGTISKANGAIISALYQDTSGPSAKLQITLPLASMIVCVQDSTGAVIECGVKNGIYTLLVDPGATGTWYWAINKQGYVFATGSFTPGSGGLFANAPSCPQVLTSTGTPMYQGTTSALVQVTFAGGYAYVDIGNGTPSLQNIFDACEDALYTANGIDWIIDGYDSTAIFNSFGGDYLFLTGGWRIRRWHVGDSLATVPAFVQSTEGIPVDEANGPVAYLTSDNPTAIAAAVRANLAVELARIDAAITSRMATFAYIAPANADIAAVKAKTDNLPAAPAAVGDIPTAAAIATAVGDGTIATGWSRDRAMRKLASLAVAKTSGFTSGGGTTVSFRTLDDTGVEFSAVLDANGNRTAVTQGA